MVGLQVPSRIVAEMVSIGKDRATNASVSMTRLPEQGFADNFLFSPPRNVLLIGHASRIVGISDRGGGGG